ncbi:hypothetical protein LOAG_00172 [Loa loa]|uniref:Uncharacterized protein n=2 Tax=Loa loa TaxID=7209 RepID=A0A1S0UCD4_LOALO|nr:hypothetical protein LOAG_00172 [Loa loa]EFO28315.1 hypothetical protein LOAG_00172 [Loa loa]
MLMGFMVTLIFICMFVILSIYIYYKEKGEELFTDKGGPAKVKLDKAHSPYIITPEQKFTQQFLSTEVTFVECSANDIVQLLRYMASYGEFSEDVIYQTPRSFFRLVTRGKTKFDKNDSKSELETAPKSGSKLEIRDGNQASNIINKSKK